MLVRLSEKGRFLPVAEIALSTYPRARSPGGMPPRAILTPGARSAVGGYVENAVRSLCFVDLYFFRC